MSERTCLIDPQYFDANVGAGETGFSLELQGIDQARFARQSADSREVTVGVRSNGNPNVLNRVLKAVNAQVGVDPEVLVLVNNDDLLSKNAAEAAGAEVLKIDHYRVSKPEGMNELMRCASYNQVFLTDRGAELVTNIGMFAALRQMEDPRVAGVYSRILPGEGASWLERKMYLSGFKRGRQSHDGSERMPFVRKIGLGASTGVIISADAWKEGVVGPFDEEIVRGGEDTKWAVDAIGQGHKIVYEPLLTAYRGEGLSQWEVIKSIWHWTRMSKGERGGYYNPRVAFL